MADKYQTCQSAGSFGKGNEIFYDENNLIITMYMLDFHEIGGF